MSTQTAAERSRRKTAAAQKKAAIKADAEARQASSRREQLYARIKREDAPRYFEKCKKEIRAAERDKKFETTIELACCRGRDYESSYPWSILRSYVEELLRADGYRVSDSTFYREENCEGYGDETHVQITIRW